MSQTAEDHGVEEQPQPAREIDPELLHQLIAKLAYFRAERRGFAPGHELCDWLTAEALVHGYLRTPVATAGAKARSRSEAGRGELGAMNEIAAGMAESSLFPSVFLPAAESR
jgi:hypothetical protein